METYTLRHESLSVVGIVWRKVRTRGASSETTLIKWPTCEQRPLIFHAERERQIRLAGCMDFTRASDAAQRQGCMESEDESDLEKGLQRSGPLQRPGGETDTLRKLVTFEEFKKCVISSLSFFFPTKLFHSFIFIFLKTALS